MTISNELMKAILSMDAYNRGYGAGISNLSDATDGSIKIGNATLINTSTEELGTGVDSSIGFYALAYSYGGETVISI